MFRPERMSKVSITGGKSVMEDVIRALHELGLVQLADYDERWEDFHTGNPLEQAESVSERLVTVRALENTLDLDPEDVGPGRLPDDQEAIDERLETVRSRVNELEDERNELVDRLRALREERETLEPLEILGIDLELLHGYEMIELAVGTGSADVIADAIAASDAIDSYELFQEGGVVAIAARPVAGATGVISEALVGVEFSPVEVPERRGDPAERRAEVEHEIRRLENALERVDNELEDVKLEHGGFLLALEEALTVEAQRAEAPLHFATTEHSFIAEGWVPSRRFDELEAALVEAAGDRVEVDELERVSYDSPHEGHEAAATDGGHLEMHGAHPPVIQRNPSILKPFEVFVQTVNRPRYHELDPTIFVFLTFPLAFGYMIGDIGYGLMYVAMGWAVFRYTDNEALRALGAIAVWAGVFTILFGYLYDDMFGVHLHDLGLHLPLAGSLSKGLEAVSVAQTWIIASILFGVLHLSIGFIMGFLNDLHHGVKDAFAENGAWLLVLWGLFAWIFTTSEVGTRPSWLAGPAPLADTDLTAVGIKPAFLVGSEGVLFENDMFALGFAGFSETVATFALAMIVVGAIFVLYGEGGIGLIEIPTKAFGHAISYIRMMAVLLAKGGMAFAVNLLVFGAYESSDGYTVFNLPTTDVSGYEPVFVGLVHLDPIFITIPVAILVFIFGHIIVLLLGITAAGIQMTRLEYVEFFGKFYSGGGAKFQPFGYKSARTQEK